MKGLAAFAMRGRLQALAIAVGGAGSLLFCWISAAVIALVTLRKGAGEGLWLFAWAVLPAGVLFFVFGDSGPLALLIGTLVLALVLRGTVSLALTLLASVLLGLVIGVALLALGGEYLQQLVDLFGQFLASLAEQAAQGKQAVEITPPTVNQVAGMLGSGTAVLSVLSLLLARYWQASLYNPGGFGEEFRALRYPVGVTALLVLSAFGLGSLGVEYRTWAMILVIPLSFAGLALVHARVAAKGQGTGWLAWFYIAWGLLDPVKLAVVMFAVLDSWMNFRARWSEPPDSTKNQDND
ncbi:MAG: hypothetical protein AB8C02_07310 [Halioglobus sp.]